MDRRTIIGLGVVAAIVGFYFWRNSHKTDSQPTDQGPAEAAQAYYTQPPSVGIQTDVADVVTNQNGTPTVNSRQTMPLPYNT